MHLKLLHMMLLMMLTPKQKMPNVARHRVGANDVLLLMLLLLVVMLVMI